MSRKRVQPDLGSRGRTFTCMWCLRTYVRKPDFLYHKCFYDVIFDRHQDAESRRTSL